MTSLQVAALKPQERSYRVVIEAGLEIRIAPSGVKTWFVRYVVDGKRRGVSLSRPFGPVSNATCLSLADARLEAAAIRARARDGVDLHVEKDCQRALELQRQEHERAAAEAARLQYLQDNVTVGELFQFWLRDGVQRADDNAELKRSYKADVLPHIGQIPVRELTEHHVRALLRIMVARDANRAAVMVCDTLTQLFHWAEKRQPWRKLLAEGNPMDLIEIEKIVPPDFDIDYQRERVLCAEEIVDLQRILRTMREDYEQAPNRRSTPQPLERTTELSFWIMLSTLCRVGELCKARWEHVDFEEARWTIPKQNVKRKLQRLEVQLSAFSLRQFRALHALTGHTPWCFPSRDHSSHLDAKTISKQVGDRQAMFKHAKDGTARKRLAKRRLDDSLVLAGGKYGAWTPHDLRRTGATMMQALKVPLDVIDRCQNHVMPGSKVRRHYLHYGYAEEKQAAWRALGERLDYVLAHRNM